MKIRTSPAQTDALREVVSIGAGNAATALSQMIKKRTNIAVPRVRFLTVNEAGELFGGKEQIVTAVYLQLLGDVTGVILFAYMKDAALNLADLLLGKKSGSSKVLNEISQSAIKEASTILSGAYLSAISKLLKMRLLISSPSIATDMAGAIIDNVLIETSKEAEHAIIMETEFDIKDEKILAYFCFVPDTGSMKKLLKAMGI